MDEKNPVNKFISYCGIKNTNKSLRNSVSTCPAFSDRDPMTFLQLK